MRWLGNVASPGDARGRLAILYYHRVMAQPDDLLRDDVDAGTFDGHMGMLASWFNVLPLGEACARLASGTLPPRAACVTFDDGYADNEQQALPILRRHGLTATFFVATGYSGGRCMFNDEIIETVRNAAAGTHDLSPLGLGILTLGDTASRRAAIDSLIGKLKYRPTGERETLVQRAAETMRSPPPRGLMMNAEQIARLHCAGMEIGAHTVRHPILTSVSDDQAREELTASKRALEDIVGAPVTLFAYPNGKPGRDYAPRHVRFVREAGYAAAVSTVDGVATRGADLYQLPRHGPWDRNPSRLGARMLLACARAGAPPAPRASSVATNA